MNYLLLNLLFSAIAAAAIWPFRAKINAKIALPALIVLLATTAIFDNLIVANSIVDYAPEKIIGWRIFTAPIEDFGYAIVGVWLIPAIFKFFEGRFDE